MNFRKISEEKEINDNVTMTLYKYSTYGIKHYKIYRHGKSGYEHDFSIRNFDRDFPIEINFNGKSFEITIPSFGNVNAIVAVEVADKIKDACELVDILDNIEEFEKKDSDNYDRYLQWQRTMYYKQLED